VISNPRPGQRVRVWYRASLRPYVRYHGREGLVVTPGRGRPRNHTVRVGEDLVIIPAGNLRPVPVGR
jgi:hypothetical protein